ncbi:MAG: PTS system mannose/fructose/sorbose family transporter subunit IID [Deltaproteobacteria bacterium]|nr:PTS system mannose/fructose/sorbose family transporter subunit IID [Deltaproteobacteria bacterium]
MKKRSLSFVQGTQLVVRSFFLQAAWNYENFQGIGFAYMLVPFLPRGVDDGEVSRRYLRYFNTNPYFAGMIAGGTLRLEMERAEGHVSVEQIDLFREDLTGALGALGDSFVWGTLRPLAGLSAVLTAMFSETMAPLFFLLFYNSVTLWLRVSGIVNGYGSGLNLLQYLKRLELQKKIYWMNALTLFAVGAFLPLWGIQALPMRSFAYFGLCGFLLVVIAGAWLGERRGVPLSVRVVFLFLLSLFLTHMGWITF